MKIVDRQTFLALPPETLFSKFEPNVFDLLMIKGETLSADDFCYQEIGTAIDSMGDHVTDEMLDDSQRHGTSIPMTFDVQGRDGCYDQEQLFAVWEAEDVTQLIARLRECLS